MHRYSFYMVHCDPTTSKVPNLQFVEAETLDAALNEVCREHGFKLLERERVDDAELVWVELPDGRMARYQVRGHED